MAILRRAAADSHAPAAVNRRDFLRLSTQGRQRVLELSCERLYMHYVDGRRPPDRKPGKYDANQLFWDGEPTAEMTLTPTGELFRQLERELASADVLRIFDRSWLAGTEFKQQVETRIDEFRRRGGQVEYRGPAT